MSLFKSKKEKETKAPPHGERVSKPAKEKKSLSPGNLRIDEAKGIERASGVIISPRITERASLITEDNGYTFNINPRATKNDVKRAIQEIYGVKPIRVTIIYRKSKTVWVRGKYGTKSGGKKAIVFLPEGQKIEFV